MRRSPQSIEEIETQIAKAAIKLGPNLESFSIQELAKEANIAIGTIYRVLPTKIELNAIVKNYAQSEFDKIILIPIRATLDLKGRFETVFSRILDFAIKNPKMAQYLAINGFDENSNFSKAINAFLNEIAPMSNKNPSLSKIGLSLIWGPIASLLLSGAMNSEDYKSLSPIIWNAISA